MASTCQGFVALLAVVGVPGPAAADEVSVGTVLRTDLGTNRFRAAAGWTRGPATATVIVDPLGYASGSQHDTDVVVEWQLGASRWAALGGWRYESNPVLGVRYHLEKPVLGVSGEMPWRPLGAIRIRFAAEMAVTLVDHGPGLPTIWLWEQTAPIHDATDLGFWLRVDYARAL